MKEKDKKLERVLKTRVTLEQITKFKNKYSSVRRWLEGISYQSLIPLHDDSSTIHHYMCYLIKFCKWLGKNPDEIIKERLKDTKKGSDVDNRSKYECLVQSFSQGYKRQEKLVACRESVVGLKSFFRYNSVPLLVKSPRKVLEKERVRLTIDEIRKILKFCDPRERAFVLLCLQTGARPCSLLSSTYGDIKADFESKTLPVKIHFPVFRVKGFYAPYTVLFGKDAYEALYDYFELRKHGTEKIKPERITDSSPLMRKVAIHKPETYAGLNKMCKKLTNIAYMLGINKKITPYAFRRTFQTIMEQHMPVNWVDRLMGHIRFKGIQGEAYSQPTIEELVEKYKEAEPYISISERKANSESIGLEVLSYLAKVYNINLGEIIERKSVKSLDEMTKGDINSLYDEFRKLLGTAEQLISPQPKKEDFNDRTNDGSLNTYLNRDGGTTLKQYQFKIVTSDEDLISSLENEWELEKEMSNRKYILKKRVSF